MQLDPSVPTGREAIRIAVDDIRRRAWDAANNADDDILCCWQFVMVRGHEHVQQTRVSPDGSDSTPIVTAVEPGVAQHTALWHPNMVLRAATLLEVIGREAKNVPEEVLRRAVELSQSVITDHRDDECGTDCGEWHHITKYRRKELGE